MKKLLPYSILLIFIFNDLKSQELPFDKIDTSNYYNYEAYKTGNIKYLKDTLFKQCLQRHEIAQIIINEMAKSGYDGMANVMYKLEDGKYITLDVYDVEHDIGFVYIGIRSGGGEQMRKIKSPYLATHNADYQQVVRGKGGVMIEANLIKKLPDNIKIIWAELYWYEYTKNKGDAKYLINKSVAEKILMTDIKKHLKK